MLFSETGRKPTAKKVREMMYPYQNGRCMYCGRKLGLAYLHIDHKTPLSRDGRDTISNKQLVCSPCNTRKGDLTDGEFRRKYKLTPSRQANNKPPSRAIPQSYFQQLGKEIAKRKAKANSKKGWFF